MVPLGSKRGEPWLREKKPRSQRVSLFLTQSQLVECEMKFEGLLGDRLSPRLCAREIAVTISGSQTK